MTVPPYLLFHGIEENAVNFPNNTAFSHRNEQLNYLELSLRSNRLANMLLGFGLQRGARVGIYCRQSLHVPVAVFGIQKAAAAYVPIDHQTPLARLQQIIDEFNIEILITEDEKVSQLALLNTNENSSRPVVLIGLESSSVEGLDSYSWNDVGACQACPPNVKIEEHDLAYIMTTSGSTGVPKGIMHTHSSGLSYAKLSASTYGVSRDDRLGNFVPLHFDISTFGYFTGTLVGACTILIPEEFLLFPASLVDLIEKENISIWYSSPFLLVQIAQQGLFAGRKLDKLRWVKFGGEVMHPKYLRKLMRELPGAQFSNVYGPAEVNQCTYQHFTSPPLTDDTLPIGQVWDLTESLIVDEDDNESDQGELLICSPTMMKAYWQEELNHLAFYFHPHPEGNRKYYRTGDLVCKNQEDQLVFVGRKDRQVKVRGYRVELDEIELVLVSHEAVQEAVAMVSKNQQEKTIIIVAVTLIESYGIAERELIAFGSNKLPKYALPGRIKILDVFPRTSSGKIDRIELASRLA